MPLTVEKIENGTVIDHIEAGKGLAVLSILKIGGDHCGRVALVMNVPSKKIGKKDIVKIEGKHIDEKAANKIALIAPRASFNLIKNGEVIEKNAVEIPKLLKGVLKCPNPRCITNHEFIETCFKRDDGELLCTFCEKSFKSEDFHE